MMSCNAHYNNNSSDSVKVIKPPIESSVNHSLENCTKHVEVKKEPEDNCVNDGQDICTETVKIKKSPLESNVNDGQDNCTEHVKVKKEPQGNCVNDGQEICTETVKTKNSPLVISVNNSQDNCTEHVKVKKEPRDNLCCVVLTRQQIAAQDICTETVNIKEELLDNTDSSEYNNVSVEVKVEPMDCIDIKEPVRLKQEPQEFDSDVDTNVGQHSLHSVLDITYEPVNVKTEPQYKEVHYLLNNHNNRKIALVDGYTFCNQKKTKSSLTWVCSSKRNQRCRARFVTTLNEQITRMSSEHTHDPPKYFVEGGVLHRLKQNTIFIKSEKHIFP